MTAAVLMIVAAPSGLPGPRRLAPALEPLFACSGFNEANCASIAARGGVPAFSQSMPRRTMRLVSPPQTPEIMPLQSAAKYHNRASPGRSSANFEKDFGGLA